MADKTAASSGGIGFFGLLAILFITLKLIHVIAWSWFWVLSPVIFSAGLIVIILVVGIVVAILK